LLGFGGEESCGRAGATSSTRPWKTTKGATQAGGVPQEAVD